MKVFIPYGSATYANWLPDVEIVDSFERADVMLLTGGTDVNPLLYHETPHINTDDPHEERDKLEGAMVLQAIATNKPIIGICRGAQLLCVMAGGKLIQHQENKGSHKLTTYDKRVITVTSDHHQAAFPWAIKRFEVLGYTTGLSRFHLGGNGKEMLVEGHVEIEDVYYPDINALAIQSHPEWMFPPSGGTEAVTITYYQELVGKFLRKEL